MSLTKAELLAAAERAETYQPGHGFSYFDTLQEGSPRYAAEMLACRKVKPKHG